MLTRKQVQHIARAVRSKNLRSFQLESEVIDFISCAVEARLAAGEPFDTALKVVMKETDIDKIHRVQKSTTKVRKPNTIDMFQNYLKIAYRNFWKYRVNTAINVFGLVLGLGTSIIIGLYLQHEFSYDKDYPDVDRLYRVNSISYMGQSPSHLDAVSPKLRDEAIAQIPEITQASLMDFLYYKRPLRWGNKSFYDYGFAALHQDFLSMFDVQMLEGTAESIYDKPRGVFISKSFAERIFDKANPVGEVLTLLASDGEKELEVLGVYADMPVNTHFVRDQWSRFDMVTSMESAKLMTGHEYHWGSIQNSMFVKLAPGVDEQLINDKLNAIIEANLGDKVWYEHYIQPVSDMHLNQRGYEVGSEGDLDQLYLFSAIAVLILLIACINYVNLTTAQASVRLKEVGVRKVIGAKRSQFIFQFLVEATVVSFLSMLLAIGLVWLVIPSLNSNYDLNLNLSLTENLGSAMAFLGIMAIVSLLCGTYPGFYLSKLQANQLLKSGSAVKSGGGLFRKILVVVQYTTSITLIIATLVITNQLQYLSNKDLGFDKEQVVYVNVGHQQSRKYGETFFNEVLRLPGVLHASLTGNSLAEGGMSGNGILVGEMAKEDREMHQVLPVDFDYQNTLGIELTEGRWFSEEFATDRKEGYIVNEAFVSHFGLDEPLGKKIARNGQWGTIVGVVKDFHYRSMRSAIAPLVIFMAPRDDWGYSQLALRLSPGDATASLEGIEKAWESVLPDFPFNFTFLDEQIDAQYRSDREFMSMFSVFSLLAIVVSCLGLIGLVSFSTKRRSKEIGVRKVLGATVLRILKLISMDLVRLILVGALLAMPIAYFFMQDWLENFEYRTQIAWWVFAAALVITVLISWLSVSYISFRAARANPVDSLRTE